MDRAESNAPKTVLNMLLHSIVLLTELPNLELYPVGLSQRGVTQWQLGGRRNEEKQHSEARTHSSFIFLTSLVNINDFSVGSIMLISFPNFL